MRLLASAIAGRPVDIAAPDRGQAPWTDGTTVFAADIPTAVVLASLIDPTFPLPPLDPSALDAARAAIDLRRTRRALRRNPLLVMNSRGLLDQTSQEVREGDENEPGYVGTVFNSPVGTAGVLGKLLARLLQSTRDRDGGAPAGGDAPTHFSRGTGRGGNTVIGAARATESQGIAATAGALRYPEWDAHRRRYRPDWCTVIEHDVAALATAAAPSLDPAPLRRNLARLHLGLTPVHRRAQGDDIDIDAAVEAFVDEQTGYSPSTDLHIENVRRARDLAVFVLLDVSGSAGEPGVAGKTVHEHQVAATVALATALHDLGDRVAVATFNSRGRDAVQFGHVKAFDERLTHTLGVRLAAVTPGAYTRLGAAIRHATAVVQAKAGTPRRLLVVISDGFAYDHGYEGHYGEADAARALHEARQRGVGCLCVSTGAEVDASALQRVFGSAAHANVPRSERLAPVIARLIHDGLRTAERRAS